MGRLIIDKCDVRRVREISEDLAKVDLADAAGVRRYLPAIRELLELDTVAVYSVRNVTGRWSLDRWDAVSALDDLQPLMRRVFEKAPEFPLFYNPLLPPPKQRNRVVDALEWIKQQNPGAWESSAICVDALHPVGLAHHHQPRVLLCDGPMLLAWFGGLHSEPTTARQTQLLGMLVEPMRRRLIAEDRLRQVPYMRAALDVALERIGAPAFVIDGRGTIRHTNSAGQHLLERDRAGAEGVLRAAVAGRPSSMTLDLVPISDGAECGSLYLAIVTAATAEDRIAAAVSDCRARWRLTPKQTEVLKYVAAGLSNAAIAARMGCVERTVELHVSALFERADVESRAALVARVLTSS